MDEREYRQNRSGNNFNKSPGPIHDYEQYMYGGYNAGDRIEENSPNATIEELDKDDEQIFDLVASKTPRANQPTVQIESDTLSDAASEIGLTYIELGSDFQELSSELTSIGDTSSDAVAWWQSTMNDLPYLGGLVEPEAGRLLLNLGDDRYALLTGDRGSIQDYMLQMRQYSPSSAFFLNYSLLSSFDSGVVESAKDIMMGSRDSDLIDFIDAAKRGNVDINNLDSQAVPLLNWMALQAGEQSTDIKENQSASAEQTVFAAAISGDTMFVHPYSDGIADNLVESIESVYELVETAPNDRKSELLKMLDLELLDIVNDDNRWGITDNDLRRMTDRVERFQRELSQTIERLLREESEAEAAE